VLNLSFAGLFIKGPTNYKRGEILDIELEIPAIGRIPMSIEVAWIDSSERKGIGVEILEIPEEYKKIWAYFVKACHVLLEAKEEYQKIQAKSE
jgi:Tfp pilus assembly protein PilZ